MGTLSEGCCQTEGKLWVFILDKVRKVTSLCNHITAWTKASVYLPVCHCWVFPSVCHTHTYMHTLSLRRAIPPIHIMAPFPYIRLLLLIKHVCRMWNPLPPHFQSTGKGHSPFVYAGMSRRQVAGLQTDGLNKSFLPLASHLFPRMPTACLHL